MRFYKRPIKFFDSLQIQELIIVETDLVWCMKLLTKIPDLDFRHKQINDHEINFYSLESGGLFDSDGDPRSYDEMYIRGKLSPYKDFTIVLLYAKLRKELIWITLFSIVAPIVLLSFEMNLNTILISVFTIIGFPLFFFLLFRWQQSALMNDVLKRIKWVVYHHGIEYDHPDDPKKVKTT